MNSFLSRKSAIFVAPLTVAFLLSTQTKQALAAHWELTYTATGTNRWAPYSGTVQQEDWSELYPGEFSNTQGRDGDSGLLFYSYPSDLPLNSSNNYPGLTSKVTGTVTVILTWTQDPGETTLPAPPEWTGIEVRGYVGAYYSGQDEGATAKATMGEIAEDAPGIQINQGHIHSPGDGYVPEGWSTDKSISGSYIRVKPSNNQNVVTFTIPLQAEVQSFPGTTTVYNRVSSHYLCAEITALPKNYVATIHSAIEKSYKRGTGILPAIYNLRDSNNNLIYESQQVGGMNTPTDTSDDVWKLECIRAANGSITVESAARWVDESSVNPNPTVTPGWFAPPTHTAPGGSGANDVTGIGALVFNSQIEGFSSPAYTWNWSGGTPVNTTVVTSNSSLAFNSYLSELDSKINQLPISGLRLGTAKNGSDLTAQTSIDLTVAESNNSSLKATNKYNVKWHIPAENTRYDPSQVQNLLTSRFFPGYGRHVNVNNTYSETIAPNQTTKFYEGPREVNVDYGPALKTVSVSAAVIGASIGSIGLIGGATVLTGGTGVAIMAGLAFASAITGVINGTPPDAVLNEGPTASIDEWRVALQTQKNINDDIATGGPYAQSQPRFTGSTATLNDALEEISQLQTLYGANWKDHWNESYYFGLHGDQLTSVQKNGYLVRINHILQDVYDAHGYVGEVKTTHYTDTAIFHAFIWTYTGSNRPEGQE